MDFNFDNERPIYIQLAEKLRIAIISGAYPSGSRLPSVRELALTAKVNPNTLQKALVELENDKLIYTERTNGKFVTKDKNLIEKNREYLAKEKVKNYLSDMSSIGINFEDSIKYLQKLGGNKWLYYSAVI